MYQSSPVKFHQAAVDDNAETLDMHRYNLFLLNDGDNSSNNDPNGSPLLLALILLGTVESGT